MTPVWTANLLVILVKVLLISSQHSTEHTHLKREIYGGGETKRSHIFLFTDLIVFTKPLRRGKFVIVDFCKLEDVFLLHSSNILEFHLLHNKIGSRVMMQFFCQKTEYWYTSLQSDPATQITEEGTYTNYKCHNLPEYKANEDHRATGFMTDLEFDAGDTIFLLWEFEDRSTLDVTYFGFNLRTREKGYLPRSKVTRVKNCSYDVSKERKRVFLMQPDAQERMRHYAQVNPQVRILLSSLNNVQGYG